MDKDRLSPELEQMVSQVKLKEPPQELMKDYLSGVNAKIEQGSRGPGFGLPQAGLLFLVGIAAVGVAYLLLANPKKEPAVQGEVIVAEMSAPMSSQETATTGGSISTEIPIEDQMAILEAFEGEYEAETIDLLGDEELFEELTQLDELELSPAQQPARVSGF